MKRAINQYYIFQIHVLSTHSVVGQNFGNKRNTALSQISSSDHLFPIDIDESKSEGNIDLEWDSSVAHILIIISSFRNWVLPHVGISLTLPFTVCFTFVNMQRF